MDWQALTLSVQLAAVTLLVLLPPGLWLARWLASTRIAGKAWIEALVVLPLVLPPTVLGFYLLVLLGPQGPVGGPWEALGGPRLVFSFPGLVIGSFLFSLPFVVQPVKNAFTAMGPRVVEAAATLGAAPLDRFFTIALPMARRSIVAAAALGFAHTVGEFGVVLMIGGSIPGRTKVVSIAIFEHVEALEYGQAHLLAAMLMAFSFAVLLPIYALGRRDPGLWR